MEPRRSHLRNAGRQTPFRGETALQVLHAVGNEDAQKYLPTDRQLTQIADSFTHSVAVKSSPPEATVEIKDYLSPDDQRFSLGKTPMVKVRIPNGYFRWRVSKLGVGEFVGAPERV